MSKKNGSEEKRKKGIVILCSSVFFIIVLLLSIIEWYRGTFDFATLTQNICLSVLCSIVASFIYAFIQKGIEEDYSKAIQSKLDIIDNHLKIYEELYDSGIISVRKKAYYDHKNEFWNDILRCTDERLDLVGHSINTWFAPDYKKVFCEKVQNMIKIGKDVRIIITTEDGTIDWEKIIQADVNDHSSLTKTEKTCYELVEIARKLEKEERTQLKLYIAKSEMITYLYIRTDKQCFISPYILSPRNTKNSFLLELETAIDYSKSFEEDVEEIIGKSNYQKWGEILS